MTRPRRSAQRGFRIAAIFVIVVTATLTATALGVSAGGSTVARPPTTPADFGEPSPCLGYKCFVATFRPPQPTLPTVPTEVVHLAAHVVTHAAEQVSDHDLLAQIGDNILKILAGIAVLLTAFWTRIRRAITGR